MVHWPWTKRTRRLVTDQRLHRRGQRAVDEEEDLEDRNQQTIHRALLAQRGEKRRRTRRP